MRVDKMIGWRESRDVFVKESPINEADNP